MPTRRDILRGFMDFERRRVAVMRRLSAIMRICTLPTFGACGDVSTRTIKGDEK